MPHGSIATPPPPTAAPVGPTTGPADHARPIPFTRRRPLPGGRAVVGGLLVTLAVVGTFALQSRTANGPTTRYLVATRSIVAGQPISADMLTAEAIDLPDEVANRAFRAGVALDNAVAVSSIAAGELVQRSALAAADSGASLHLLTVTLSRARALDGDIRADTKVDVIATTNGCTSVIAVGVVVRDQPAKTGNELGSDNVIVRLGIRTNEELLMVAHAAETGKLMLARPAASGSAGNATNANATSAGKAAPVCTSAQAGSAGQ